MQIECPHCHEMNDRRDVFCLVCGEQLRDYEAPDLGTAPTLTKKQMEELTR